MERIEQVHPGRILKVDFDQLCDAPAAQVGRIASFVGAPDPGEILATFTTLLGTGSPGRGRHKGLDRGVFDTGDLEYVRGLGYGLG